MLSSFSLMIVSHHLGRGGGSENGRMVRRRPKGLLLKCCCMRDSRPSIRAIRSGAAMGERTQCAQRTAGVGLRPSTSRVDRIRSVRSKESSLMMLRGRSSMRRTASHLSRTKSSPLRRERHSPNQPRRLRLTSITSNVSLRFSTALRWLRSGSSSSVLTMRSGRWLSSEVKAAPPQVLGVAVAVP